MDEGDLEAEQACARLSVDQLGTGAGKRRKRGAQIGNFVGDVVHPRPAVGEEAPDRRLLSERGEQLHAALADEHGRCLHALIGDGLTVLELGAEQARVRLESLVEVFDRDAQVMDPARLHARDATRRV